MKVDIPTMFMMLIAICLILAICVRWFVHSQNDQGLEICFWSMIFFACGLSLLLLRHHVPDVISIVLANTIVTTGYSLLLLSVIRFQKREVPSWVLWGPILFILIAFSLVIESIYLRLLINAAVSFIQSAIIIYYLMSQDASQPSRGRNLMVLGLGINLLALVGRLVATIIQNNQQYGLLSNSFHHFIFNFSNILTLMFVVNGMMMMAKDRSDHLNSLMVRQDNLTGCWNRIRIQEIAQQEMARLERYGHPVSLLMIDLDNFKKINDKFGHAAGDTILCGFVNTAWQSLRTTDVLGRWGGEEFVAILPSTGLAGAIETAERILSSLETQIFPNSIQITASIGIAIGKSTDSWSDWLGRADAALYRAKANGRNRVELETLETAEENDINRQDAHLVTLTWRSTYETGYAEIDMQHRLLFDKANDFLQLILQKSSSEVLIEYAGRLADDIRRHMQDEESFLWDKHHPMAASHTVIHNKLLAQVDEMIACCQQGQIGSIELFHYIVYEVIAQHMLIEDQKLNIATLP
ncbi:diguanylate cyclase [Prodigiosinella confusarubida]|uniref:diguanylate cyclase n=2 Tax=Serratia sp. (strain ATCC 39006) TaxID=104623 RepID=A0A2I5T3H0_SERS3|nr:diguanylate cyclase [Serratia sp. ATCC 39006]AUH03425.1 diguanylate cyclase [Serratia sp. ATCC 39006]